MKSLAVISLPKAKFCSNNPPYQVGRLKLKYSNHLSSLFDHVQLYRWTDLRNVNCKAKITPTRRSIVRQKIRLHMSKPSIRKGNVRRTSCTRRAQLISRELEDMFDKIASHQYSSRLSHIKLLAHVQRRFLSTSAWISLDHFCSIGRLVYLQLDGQGAHLNI